MTCCKHLIPDDSDEVALRVDLMILRKDMFEAHEVPAKLELCTRCTVYFLLHLKKYTG